MAEDKLISENTMGVEMKVHSPHDQISLCDFLESSAHRKFK